MHYLQLNKQHPPTGYWDHTMLNELGLSDNIVLIPGAYQVDYLNQLNDELEHLKPSLVIVTSDEEQRFPLAMLNSNCWSQYGDYNGFSGRVIPIGYAPDPPKPAAKTISYLFAGQVNTQDRRDLIRAMEYLDGEVLPSPGFSQGLKKAAYNLLISEAKIVPCPGGYHSPDSFRLYEALEAGCTPVVNDRKFFTKVFGEFPFPCVDDWQELADIKYVDYSDWWHDYKAKLAEELCRI